MDPPQNDASATDGQARRPEYEDTALVALAAQLTHSPALLVSQFKESEDDSGFHTYWRSPLLTTLQANKKPELEPLPHPQEDDLQIVFIDATFDFTYKKTKGGDAFIPVVSVALGALIASDLASVDGDGPKLFLVESEPTSRASLQAHTEAACIDVSSTSAEEVGKMIGKGLQNLETPLLACDKATDPDGMLEQISISIQYADLDVTAPLVLSKLSCQRLEPFAAKRLLNNFKRMDESTPPNRQLIEATAGEVNAAFEEWWRRGYEYKVEVPATQASTHPNDFAASPVAKKSKGTPKKATRRPPGRRKFKKPPRKGGLYKT